MPSVRVKRGYSSLQESAPDTPGPSHRPRTRSLAALLSPRPTHPAHHSHEPQTTSAQYRDDIPSPPRAPPANSGGDDSPGHCISLLHRPPSRVSHHIMGSTRNPHAALRPSQLISEEDSNPFFSNGAGPRKIRRRSLSFTGGRDEEDMISLEGPQTEVLVPSDDGVSGRIGSALSLPLSDSSQSRCDWDDEHHPDDIVEHLDVIDPQISTVATLTNAANSIVIPPLDFYSRKPVVVLPRRRQRRKLTGPDAEKGQTEAQARDDDRDTLDLHVEDVLRKRDRFRRVMQGVWSFVKTPLGFVTAIYSFLVVFWGTGLVLFLVHWINVHNKNTQDFWIEVSQQILTCLFSITSIGLIPFRVIDTYRVCKIRHYKRRIAMLRRKVGIPELYDPDDLPDPQYDTNYVPVLNEDEQVDLHYQQRQFMQSQTWYRPHGTQTHRAFPIEIALWICIMNDLNSLFQCLLSGCMWSLNRFERPAWTTATTLPSHSYIAGIVSGFLIYWGGRKTKRVKEVTDRLRMALAMDLPTSDGDAEHPTTSATGEGASRVPDAPLFSKPTQPLPSQIQSPQYKDFAEGPGVMPITPPMPVIRIADEMTVSPEEALDPGSQQ